ncbi:sraP: SraP [Crotalus adamanteus]|uniref:SraP: SraP n=1 Tax=Crotalus adamanteus TaxID=8729 RepID=A0AAW1BSA0_CROAD
MSSQSCHNTLFLKDILDNGFLISASSNSNSPSSSLFLDMNSAPKSEVWDSKESTLNVKVTESSSGSMKGELQTSCDSGSSFCKTPFQPSAFDLSNLSSANNSKANSLVNTFHDTKSSTPCREDKASVLTEHMVLKSSEMNDFVVFKKPLPPPIWEISGIQATVDNSLSLEASLEDTGSLGCMKTDTPSLEMSHFAMPPDPSMKPADAFLAVLSADK